MNLLYKLIYITYVEIYIQKFQLVLKDNWHLCVKSGKQRLNIIGVNGVSLMCQTANPSLWLLARSTCYVDYLLAIINHHEKYFWFQCFTQLILVPGSSVQTLIPGPGKNREATVHIFCTALVHSNSEPLMYYNIQFLLQHEVEFLKP